MSCNCCIVLDFKMVLKSNKSALSKMCLLVICRIAHNCLISHKPLLCREFKWISVTVLIQKITLALA